MIYLLYTMRSYNLSAKEATTCLCYKMILHSPSTKKKRERQQKPSAGKHLGDNKLCSSTKRFSNN